MQRPSVVRAVLYFDREEFVNATNEKRPPEPFGAVVTRVHKDDQGQDTNVVSLGVFDPEVGYQVKRDVREGSYAEDGSPIPEASRWYWPFYSRPVPSAPPPPPPAPTSLTGNDAPRNTTAPPPPDTGPVTTGDPRAVQELPAS